MIIIFSCFFYYDGFKDRIIDIKKINEIKIYNVDLLKPNFFDIECCPPLSNHIYLHNNYINNRMNKLMNKKLKDT